MRIVALCTVILCAAPYITAQSYVEEGLASWYGNEFDGRPTASGEIFNSALFTAAHPSLPFGTFLLVTNKLNNRQITVKVNDRGPFIAERIVDLSKAAAEHIDMLHSGTAPVIIETLQSTYLPSPGTQTAAAPTPAASAPTPAAPAPVAATSAPTAPVPAAPIAAPNPSPAQPLVDSPQPQSPPEPASAAAPVFSYPPITLNVYPPAPQTQSPQTPVTQPPAPIQPQYQLQPEDQYQPQYYQSQPYYPIQESAPAVTVIPQSQILPSSELTPVISSLPPLLPAARPGVTLIPAINPLPGTVYKLQVGSYKEPRHAVDAFGKLKNAGLNPTYEPNGDFYRVVLAGIRGTEVQSVIDKLAVAGFREALIREDK